MKKLSPRLKMNVDLIEPCRVVCDVGCDHGYSSIYLAQNDICEKVIAMDIVEGPLKVAKKNIEEVGLSHKIQLRLSDGLKNLKPGEANTVLISGMGGLLICQILDAADLQGIDTLVLQAQSDISEVRRFIIYGLGFTIEDEAICLDKGEYYIAIKAVRQEVAKIDFEPYKIKELIYGKILRQKKDALYIEYLKREKEKLEKILEKTDDPARKEKLDYIDEYLNGINNK